MRTLESRRNPTGECNVIVLDQHTIREVEPVILTAAATDRIFVDDA